MTFTFLTRPNNHSATNLANQINEIIKSSHQFWNYETENILVLVCFYKSIEDPTTNSETMQKLILLTRSIHQFRNYETANSFILVLIPFVKSYLSLDTTNQFWYYNNTSYWSKKPIPNLRKDIYLVHWIQQRIPKLWKDIACLNQPPIPNLRKDIYLAQWIQQPTLNLRTKNIFVLIYYT